MYVDLSVLTVINRFAIDNTQFQQAQTILLITIINSITQC